MAFCGFWVGPELDLGWTMKMRNTLLLSVIPLFGLDYVKFCLKKIFFSIACYALTLLLFEPTLLASHNFFAIC